MQTIKSRKIVTPSGVVSGELHINDQGLIEAISVKEVDQETYPNKIIMPGIIDTHNHGTMGYGLMGPIEDKETEVKGYLTGLASQGVTSVFPTAEYAFFDAILAVKDQALATTKIAGIHSEGPYLNRVGEQGVPEEKQAVDVNHLQAMIDSAKGHLKLVAIAPELENAQAGIDLLNKHGITVAYAHSDMNYAEAFEAFNNGVSVATHTANVMSGIHHRNMGGLGACLLHPDVMCELIPDGLHVSVEMMELMLKVKDFDKWMLISDTISASGAPQGEYSFGNFTITINEEGFSKSETGRLMGSTKPVIYGMNVLNKNLGLDLITLSKLASSNVADYYKLDKTGSIEVGKYADLIIVDDNFELEHTYVDGNIVYSKVDNKDLFNPNFGK
ncbi:MAG: amidohydrolase family protein [Erysipelothrix sp.]|nr:amidohydrolase family protein [Erysipelothrix sp.]